MFQSSYDLGTIKNTFKMTQNQRKKKVVKRGTQLLIAFEILLHATLLILLIYLFLFAPPFAELFSQYRLEDHQAVAKELIAINTGKWPLFILIFVFVGVLSFLFSHQIAGPIYRFERALQKLAGRSLDETIRLRKWDYFTEVETGINEFKNVVQADLRVLKQEQKNSLRILADLKENRMSQEKIDRLQQSLEKNMEKLNQYAGIDPDSES